MDISQGADEIIREAQLNLYDRETIALLVNEHGLDSAVDAIADIVVSIFGNLPQAVL